MRPATSASHHPSLTNQYTADRPQSAVRQRNKAYIDVRVSDAWTVEAGKRRRGRHKCISSCNFPLSLVLTSPALSKPIPQIAAAGSLTSTMLSLKDILTMQAPLRLAAMATITAILHAHPSHQQTYSSCNPTQQTCPGDTALGRAVSIDFRSGASSEFTPQGNPTYGSDGVSFTVSKSGDAPQLNSNWYIMFGHVEVTMKAAPGAGIVSSSVLQSDDLDEIDWEWLGAQNDQVQSNYFGKGQTTTYDRAAVHSVSDTQQEFHKYTVDWTDERIVWQIDGTTVRVLNANDANGQFPQTPMQFKLGVWSGGDPGNPQGTIGWSQGPTDYTKGPFTMVVQSCSVVDYSTGTKYTYGDTSGTWTSIESEGGAVNANAGAASGTDANAPAITSATSGNNQPFEGTHRTDTTFTTPSVYPWVPEQTTLTSATVTNTDYPGLPSGWTVSGSGKVIPPSAAPVSKPTSYIPSPVRYKYPLNHMLTSFAVDIPTRLIVLVTGSISTGLLFRLWI